MTTAPRHNPLPEPNNREPHFSWIGAVLYGLTFLIFSGLIFYFVLRPAPAAPKPVAADKPTPTQPAMPKLPLTYPPAPAGNDFDTHFGVNVADPYRWLESPDSPQTQEWLKAETALTTSFLDALPGRDALRQRYHDLLYIDTISTPSRAGDRFFYMKKDAHQEKSVLYWRSATDANEPEHVLIDLNPFVGKENKSLGETSATLDGKLLAYSLKLNNSDESTLYVMDVATGKDLPGEVIEGAKYADPSWLPDGSGFVYTWLPPIDQAHVSDRPGQAVVRYHKLGTDPKNDPIIHPKTGDPTKFIGAYISRDGKWIFFSQQNGWDKNDLYYQPLKGEPTAALAKTWKPIVVGKDATYSLYPWKGRGYILTNEGATRYRLFKVSLDNPSRAKWKEIIAESPTTVLQGVDVIGDHLILDELENVSSRIEIADLDGTNRRPLPLPTTEPVSIGSLSGEPDRNELYYSYVNFTTPTRIYQTSITNPDQQTLWAKINVPVDPSPYIVEQKYFASKDGTKVPMFIVHRKDIKMDGSTPFLLTGYGGFAVSETPYFSAGYYPWLEAGGGYAVANLRGGGEFGEEWHQNGMLLKKQNVFDDCIGAAEFLVSQGYTKPERLAFRGGSNGGLLAGAMITQRPDLFRAVICEVPLLDMIRYPQFGSGNTWVPEYGSPDNEAQFKALYAYSPYHRVVKGTAYPAVMFCSSANDDRVDPMHARKMCALLQADTSSDNPILLRIEAQSGHGGGDQVGKWVNYGTDVWGFLIYELEAKTP